ncbi:sensor histidine kinase [Streptomyces sp. NPDC050560]|uniref:sensor histidine kinase n=1 Tax=Streptomyces sp. NPDC050560 TaxID=3365630 RepID=UPI0037924B6B
MATHDHVGKEGRRGRRTAARRPESTVPPGAGVRTRHLLGALARRGEEPGGDALPLSPRSQTPAPRMARAIIVVALACYGTMTVLNVIRTHPPTFRLACCIALVVLVFTVQYAVSSPSARRWPGRRKGAVLLVQVALTYAPLVWFGTNWGSMEGPLAASLLLTLPARFGWPCYGLLVAFIPVYNVLAGATYDLVLYFTISGLLTGLVIYGLTRLTDLVHQVHATREELARMAVTQERLRFARDLHDLLGYSLSAITLKGELIQRLITARPDAAAQETDGLLKVARQALADVRLVSSGYRDMSLADEAQAAGAVLAAADIRAVVDVPLGRLHPLVDTALATALREGVTNVLRHSRVQECGIRAVLEGETVRLSLVNDRPDEQHDPEGAAVRTGGGSGLDNLRTRFAAIGGGLDAGVDGEGRFRLEVWAPARPQHRDTDSPVFGAPGPSGAPRDEERTAHEGAAGRAA